MLFRSQDKRRTVGPDEFQIFKDGAVGLGKSVVRTFPNEFDKMVSYVLDNCEEAEPYIE